jgi:hypothetical protein
MMVEITPQLVLSGLQTAGLLVGILYYILDLQNKREDQKLANARQDLMLKSQKQALETRQAQLFMNIFNNWNTPDFWRNYWTVLDREWTNYDDYQSKYGRHIDLEGNAKAATLFAFYEGLGVLVKRGFIDPHFVDDLLGGTIINYWEKMGEFYREMRVRVDYPQIAIQIEYLYDVIKPIASAENIEYLRKQTNR